MTEFEKLRVVTRYEFLKHIRRRRLYVILGIALLAELVVLILMPVLQDGYPDNVMIMAAMLTVGASLAAIGAIFFAGDAIAGEFESKTGYMLFTNPVGRTTLVIGKYLACLIAIALLVAFTYVINAISLLVIYHQVPIEILGSFGLCLFFATAVLSTTFFFSAVSKGAMGATVMTLLFVWLLSNIAESVLAFTGNPYWFLISAGSDSITLPYGSQEMLMSGFGMGGFEEMMANVKPLTIGMAVWGMTIYLVAGFVLSIWISRRRQLA